MNQFGRAAQEHNPSPRSDFIAAEILAAHEELDLIDIPRTGNGEALTLAQRCAAARRCVKYFHHEVPTGRQLWQKALRLLS